MEIQKIIFDNMSYANGMQLMVKFLQETLRVSVKKIQPYSYNSKRGDGLIWQIKNPPKGLLGVYFQGGEREGWSLTYTLKQLEQMGGKATKMFIFMLKRNPKTQSKKGFNWLFF